MISPTLPRGGPRPLACFLVAPEPPFSFSGFRTIRREAVRARAVMLFARPTLHLAPALCSSIQGRCEDMPIGRRLPETLLPMCQCCTLAASPHGAHHSSGCDKRDPGLPRTFHSPSPVQPNSIGKDQDRKS